jgi:hypothetical protein
MNLAERDVTIVQIGDNPSRLAALKTKAVQATVFTTPNTVRARKAVLSPSSTPTNWGSNSKAAALRQLALSCAITARSSSNS